MKEKLAAGLHAFVVVLALIGLLTAHMPARAQATPQETPHDQDIETIYKAQYEAINRGDAEASVALLAENAIAIAWPPPPNTTGVINGKATIRSLNQDLVDRHANFEFTDFHVNGETVNFRALIVEDVFRDIGVFPMAFSGTAVVQDGLVVSETWIMDKDSLARLTAAMALGANKAILRQAYEQIFTEGKLELLDETITPDAIDHGFPELRGVEAFKGPIADMRAAFPDLKAKAEFMIAEGDLVMALATFTGTHQGDLLGIPATGKTITWLQVDINRIQDGKVVEAWHIGVPSAILQALGYQLTPPTH